MKTLVAYYSRTENNLYLANRIAKELNADKEAIKPRINAFTLFLMNIGFGVKKMKSNFAEYDRVIMVGPIWVGRFIHPLKAFTKRYINKIDNFYFVTCCGSTYEKKNDKFGHELVFTKVREITGDKLKSTLALPITLVVPADKLNDDQYIMKTRLSDQNFEGEIKERFDAFITTLN